MPQPRRHTRNHLLGGAIVIAAGTCIILMGFGLTLILITALVEILR